MIKKYEIFEGCADHPIPGVFHFECHGCLVKTVGNLFEYIQKQEEIEAIRKNPMSSSRARRD